VQANIDTGYKKTADADSGKSTVEDQLHEAEANKNASAFVKEFKEDLGATDKKSEEDKKDIQQREGDKIGLERARKEAESSNQKQQ